MHPCALRLDARTYLTDRVEGSGVDVACLDTDDARTRQIWNSVGAHAALIVDRHPNDAIASEPDNAERLEQRRVGLGADDQGDLRSAEETVGFDIPPRLSQNRVAGSGERRHMCRRRAG